MTTDIAAILRQRDELKARDPGCILLFRVEDKLRDGYWAFEEDAVALRDANLMGGPIGQSLRGGVDLTRPRGKYFWVDPRDLETFLDRLVKAGKRAAVCERVEGPAPKGAEVERIATEGVAPWGHPDDDDDDDGPPVPDKMGPLQAVDLLDHVRGDPEGGHKRAERIVCSLLRGVGHGDVADAFERARRRCGFWYA